jgi:PAS domain S-box-containing protein
MDLRKKTLVILCVTIISMMILLSVISSSLSLHDYTELEEKGVVKNIERAESAISSEITHLDTFNRDWATWDDTYAFIEDQNPDFIRANMVDQTFEGTQLNLMLFVNASGYLVTGKAYNLEEGSEVPVPQSLQALLYPGSLLLTHPGPDDAVAGILSTPEGPLIISSRPILTSEGEGPSRGSLIMARYVNEEKIQDIGKNTLLSLALLPLSDPRSREEISAGYAASGEGNTAILRPMSEESIAGYKALNDVFGQPAYALRVEMPRDIYLQGHRSTFYSTLTILAVCLIFGIVTLVVLEKLVLVPLSTLNTSVTAVGSRGDPGARLDVRGNDELSNLGSSINGMLGALERIQEEHIRSERRYRAVVEDQTEMISRFLPDGTLVFVNEAYCRYFNKSREEILGQMFTPQIYAEDKERVKRHFESLSSSKSARTIEYRIVMPSGDLRWHQWTDRVVLGSGGQIVEYQSVGMDITDRRVAEEKLYAAHQRLLDIIEFLPDATFVIDADKKVIAWNHALEAMTGLKKADIIGKGDYAYAIPFYGKPRPILIDYIGEREGDAVPSYDVFEREGNTLFAETFVPSLFLGKGAHIRVKASPLYDRDGRIVGAIETIRDITRRKYAENALRLANEKLNLLSSVTRHDVLNQLTAVRGYVELAFDSAVDQMQKKYLETAYSVTFRMQDLLNFTRDYQNMGVKSPQWHNAHDTFIRAASGLNLVSVSVAINLKGLEIYADPLLEKVAYNLFDNALRHGEQISEIRVSYHAIADGIVLTFEDNGVGVSAKEKDLIFRQGYGKNTGYGLFLIHEILAITGMTICETGEPGKGARFEIRIPMGVYRITDAAEAGSDESDGVSPPTPVPLPAPRMV